MPDEIALKLENLTNELKRYMQTRAGAFGNGPYFFADATNGDDDYDGLSLATPKATIEGSSGVLSLVTDGRGDTVVLFDTGTDGFDIATSGRHAISTGSLNILGLMRPVVTNTHASATGIFGVQAGRVRFENIWFFQASALASGIGLAANASGDYMEVYDCYFQRYGTAAIQMSGTCGACRIVGNEVDTCGNGIHLEGSAPNHNRIRDNTVVNSDYGVYIEGGDDNWVLWNTIAKAAVSGIQVDAGCSRNILRSNAGGENLADITDNGTDTVSVDNSWV